MITKHFTRQGNSADWRFEFVGHIAYKIILDHRQFLLFEIIDHDIIERKYQDHDNNDGRYKKRPHLFKYVVILGREKHYKKFWFNKTACWCEIYFIMVNTQRIAHPVGVFKACEMGTAR